MWQKTAIKMIVFDLKVMVKLAYYINSCTAKMEPRVITA